MPDGDSTVSLPDIWEGTSVESASSFCESHLRATGWRIVQSRSAMPSVGPAPGAVAPNDMSQTSAAALAFVWQLMNWQLPKSTKTELAGLRRRRTAKPRSFSNEQFSHVTRPRTNVSLRPLERANPCAFPLMRQFSILMETGLVVPSSWPR